MHSRRSRLRSTPFSPDGEVAVVGRGPRQLDQARSRVAVEVPHFWGLRTVTGPERERGWRLYMLASAQAFETGGISVYQVVSARGGASPRLPLDRSQLLSTPPAAPGGRNRSEDHERSTQC